MPVTGARMRNSSPPHKEESRVQTHDNSSKLGIVAGLIRSRDTPERSKDPWMIFESWLAPPFCATFPSLSWRVKRRVVITLLFLVVFALVAPLFQRSTKETSIMSFPADPNNALNNGTAIKKIELDVRIQIVSDLHSKSISRTSPLLFAFPALTHTLFSIIVFPIVQLNFTNSPTASPTISFNVAHPF